VVQDDHRPVPRPDVVTRRGVGLTITEAVADLAEAARELTAQIESRRSMPRRRQ
jgi:hypothetical protein